MKITKEQISKLVNYFKAIGKNITEDEIENLKKGYELTKENSSMLTMQQLDSVADGLGLETRHNRKMQKQRANDVLNMFNDMANDKVAELVKNRDNLYYCRINTGKTTYRDLDLDNKEEKVLSEQIQQTNKDYIDNKKFYYCFRCFRYS